MTYSNNFEIQQRGQKIKVEDDEANHHNQEQVLLCHNFWNEAPEDLLTEIFIRLPDCRSALRTTPVCRRWHSLISRNPNFVERFKSHHRRHQHRYPTESLPWAVVIRPTSCSETDICHVYSDEWLFLHGKLPPAICFDFLPNSSDMQIRASCNDLFLLVYHKKNNLYICNPITKQFVQLPAGPRLEDASKNHNEQRGGVIAYAIVRDSPTANIVLFKVVQISLFYLSPELNDYEDDNDLIVMVAVFCSVSRKWEMKSFPCPGLDFHFSDNVVTIDGVLYWLGVDILVFLDLEKDKCGTIDIPSSDQLLCSHRIGAIPVSGGSHVLMLLQVNNYMMREIDFLKVWRFNNNNNNNNNNNKRTLESNWILVHNKRTLARPPENLSERFEGAFIHPMNGDLVHPTNGDLMLCVWGKNVFEYNLVDSTYKKIAELSKICSSSVVPFLVVGASDSSAGFDL